MDGWAGEVQSLGLEAKGLWLVDFDNGEGYYCWCYPEETVAHYHGYADGFKAACGYSSRQSAVESRVEYVDFS